MGSKSMNIHTKIVSVTLLTISAGSLMAGQGPMPHAVTDADYYDNGNPQIEKVQLGRNLFFDKILSGNQNISCASCHHSLANTGDGLSLPIGEGGKGLGVTRDTGPGYDMVFERVPRNAPPVYNLGSSHFTLMFHDGRVEEDASAPSGFRSPAGANLPFGLENILAVQAMFPVTSGTEMAGQAGENVQADAAAIGDLAGPDGVWAIIARKLQNIPAYVEMFKEAYPGEVIEAEDISFVHAANAIAAFEAAVWRFDNSPYDKYLRHDNTAMSPSALRGMRVFNGKGDCASCHSGPFQTDNEFHAIAMPQIGPGKGNGDNGHEDFGRERVTGNVTDRFKFRTPSLRNIALTAPYGHAGAYDTLEAVVRHHLDPVNSLHHYDQSQARLPSRDDLDALDFIVMDNDDNRNAIAAANELSPTSLSEQEFNDLMAFLNALTDPAALDIRHNVPGSVPSGLTLAE